MLDTAKPKDEEWGRNDAVDHDTQGRERSDCEDLVRGVSELGSSTARLTLTTDIVPQSTMRRVEGHRAAGLRGKQTPRPCR